MTASRTAGDRDARTLYVPGEAGRRHALGIALNLASAVADSASGVYTRLIPLDPSLPAIRAWAMGSDHPGC